MTRVLRAPEHRVVGIGIGELIVCLGVLGLLGAMAVIVVVVIVVATRANTKTK